MGLSQIEKKSQPSAVLRGSYAAIPYGQRYLKKTMMYIGGILSSLFCCYLYEQVFYEVFMGQIRSVNRHYELMVIIPGFLFLCCLVPVLTFLNAKFSPYKRLVLIGYTLIPMCFVLIVSFTNLCFYMGAPLIVSSKVEKADAIVVVNKGSFPLRGELGASLFHEGYASKVVVFVRESEPYRSYLTDHLNVPMEEIIWARGRLNNTEIEAETTKQLIDMNQWKNIILVTDYFHMYRMLKALKNKGVNHISSMSVSREDIGLAPMKFLGWNYQHVWDESFDDLDLGMRVVFRHHLTMKVLHEFTGILFYWFMRFI